jgi:23S rRNA (cytosine1962-C5)-methyltransferase
MDDRGGDRLRDRSSRRDRHSPARHERTFVDDPRTPIESVPTIVVTPAGARRALGRHPWIYKSDIASVPAELENGALVRVVDNRQRQLGRATWSERSQIALRIVSWDDRSVDEDFWADRLEAALARRDHVGMTGPARRIVFAEADGWPGFVVDQYADVLVVQTLTPGAERLAPAWTRLLVERLAPRAIVARNDVKVRRLEGLDPVVATWHGEVPRPFEVTIGDRLFLVDTIEGHKTGAFLDQQLNYRAAARWTRGVNRALDVFSGEGGFALHLAPVVGHVEGIESSESATARARINAERNGIDNVTWEVANAFDRLHALDADRARYDAIVLDPPAFAKNRKALSGAIRGYKEINLRALKLLNSGGVLITCSCSYHLSREDLIHIVSEAARDAGREVELLEVRTQAPDHPILLNVPETEYLKCLVLRIR